MASYEAFTRCADGEVDGVYQQVRWALTKAAIDVENEDPGTSNHTARIKWAEKYRAGNFKAPTSTIVDLVLENATIAAAVGGTDSVPTWGATDNDVQFQVNSTLNRIVALD